MRVYCGHVVNFVQNIVGFANRLPRAARIQFEKLSKVGDKPTFDLRLREEVRLRDLAGETLRCNGGGT